VPSGLWTAFSEGRGELPYMTSLPPNPIRPGLGRHPLSLLAWGSRLVLCVPECVEALMAGFDPG
jgi:hypothetical protein